MLSETRQKRYMGKIKQAQKCNFVALEPRVGGWAPIGSKPVKEVQ